ncbi:hypothetical protein ACFYRN_28850 [Streptomyces sp. NPDC005227]|uniref:hypothetical protein n=1 Tax=Streptomyces sp. NPDC005227 TaxID=3364707 RepID=UPI0036B0163B
MSRSRSFWLALTIPALACCAIAVAAGPGSWIGWAAYLAEGPAAAAAVVLNARRAPTA